MDYDKNAIYAKGEIEKLLLLLVRGYSFLKPAVADAAML